jgi:hypothetical protein
VFNDHLKTQKMTTNLININKVVEFVGNKPFSQIQEEGKTLGLDVREKDGLYLLTSGGNGMLDADGERQNLDLHEQTNGIILEKNTNKIVCASQNVFTEVDDLPQLVSNLTELPVQHRVEYCEDGTLIRLYHYGGAWYTSTNRCIDGKDSFWMSQKTFDALFWELFNRELLETLDQNYTYLFILLHSDNRIVVRHYHNQLVYISRILNRSQLTTEEPRYVLAEDYRHIFLQNTDHIRRPKFIGNLDLQHLSDGTLFHPRKRGFLIKVLIATDTWKSYIYDFPKYIKQKTIRGNVPDIKHRYLELLNDTEMLDQLFRLYPEHKSEFIHLRNQLHVLSKKIHQLYVNSHIKHDIRVEESNPFYGFLKALHAQYKNTKTPIVLNDIKQKLKLSNRWLLVNYLKTVTDAHANAN